MVKLCVLVQKRPDLSLEAFRDYALNTHAQVIRNTPGRFAPVKYVQNHVFDGAYMDSDVYTAKRDSVVEIWRESLAAFADSSASEYGKTVVPNDEKNFANAETTMAGVFAEHLSDGTRVFSPYQAPYKVFLCLERDPTVSGQEFLTRWEAAHEKALSHCPGADRLVGYCQCRSLRADSRHIHGDQPELSGCGVLYFNTREDCACIRDYWRAFDDAAHASDAPFLNWLHCFWLAVKEYPIIG